eukprot:CFRG3299T1
MQKSIQQFVRDRASGKRECGLDFCKEHHEPDKHVRSDFYKICHYDMETMVVTHRDLRLPRSEEDEKALQYEVNLVVMQHADGTEVIFDTLEAFMEHVLHRKHLIYAMNLCGS